MRRTNWKQVVTAVGLVDSSSQRAFVKSPTLLLLLLCVLFGGRRALATPGSGVTPSYRVVSSNANIFVRAFGHGGWKDCFCALAAVRRPSTYLTFTKTSHRGPTAVAHTLRPRNRHRGARDHLD